MLFCHLLIFFKINFFEKFFQEYNRVSDSLDPNQTGHFVGPDLNPNYLQNLLADNTSRQRVNLILHNQW